MKIIPHRIRRISKPTLKTARGLLTARNLTRSKPLLPRQFVACHPPTRQAGAAKLVPMMLIALIATSAGVWFGQWQSARNGDPLENLQEKLQNTLVLPDDFRSIEPFTLVGKNSEAVNEDIFRDKWSLVFFGFTFCPDVCPITLSIVNESLQQLEQLHPDTDPFQVIFVTVDPKRDSAVKLKAYVEHYNKDFQAITGELNDILAFTKSQSIVVSYNANEENEDLYGIDHTASMLLVDPQLRVRAKFNPPHEPETIAADFQTLYTDL